MYTKYTFLLFLLFVNITLSCFPLSIGSSQFHRLFFIHYAFSIYMRPKLASRGSELSSSIFPSISLPFASDLSLAPPIQTTFPRQVSIMEESPFAWSWLRYFLFEAWWILHFCRSCTWFPTCMVRLWLGYQIGWLCRFQRCAVGGRSDRSVTPLLKVTFFSFISAVCISSVGLQICFLWRYSIYVCTQSGTWVTR